MGLTQRERNELFEKIAVTGLDMAGLDFDYDDSKAEIRHRATGSYFFVVGGRRPGTYTLRWAVTSGPSSIDRGDISWMEVCGWAGDWSKEVRYLERDLWKELKQVPAAALARIAQEDVSDAPFTADELAEISERMDYVKEQVRNTSEVTAEQFRAIEQAIDDLKQSAEKVSRKDWRLLLYGQAMNLFFAYAVPPHVVQTIITTAISGLGHIFGLGGMPPALPPQA